MGSNQTLFPYMTVNEAADYLKTTPAAIINLVWCGKLRAFKPGEKLLFKKDELEMFVESSAQKTEEDGFGSDEWFTSNEAAAYLKVSPFSLRNMASNGYIPYQKLQRRNRYRKSDLIKLLMATRKGGFRGI